MTTLTHKAVTATAETTELGEFSALAATWSLDRQNEQIMRGAFKASLASWAATGRRVPLHWDHSGSASDIIGSVDPASMRERSDGLYVEGKLDLEDSETAREVWRSVKNNTIGLSFGFLVKSDRVRDDGVRELLDLDLFEVSLTPAPVNANTRVLSTKSNGGEYAHVRAKARHSMLSLLDMSDDNAAELRGMSIAEHREHLKSFGIDMRPIEIRSFEC